MASDTVNIFLFRQPVNAIATYFTIIIPNKNVTNNKSTAIRSIRARNRPGDAATGLLLRAQIHLQPASALLLRETTLHNPQRRQVLQLPEQVSFNIFTMSYAVVIIVPQITLKEID